MIDNYQFIVLLGIFCGACIWWGVTVLPEENWQFFASVPVRKQDDGTWAAVNITWYGLLLSSANVFAAMIFFIMLGSIGKPFLAGLLLLLSLLLIGVPASSLVARIVERKTATLTIGGAVFVGSLVAPFIIILINRFAGKAMGFELPIPQTLAACAVSFLFGEGMGRLSCLSYGCCYGKPVEETRGILRRLFEKVPLVFHGSSKKISYASGLEGRKVVPIQPITMIACVFVGMITLLLFAEGHYLASYLAASVFANFWRVFSEIFRADFRGEGKISAYQVMSAIAALYAVGVAFFFRDSGTSLGINLLDGALSLWSPGALASLLIIWCALVIFAGVSTTTFSCIRFSIREDRI
jgi:hypothetical protein